VPGQSGRLLQLTALMRAFAGDAFGRPVFDHDSYLQTGLLCGGKLTPDNQVALGGGLRTPPRPDAHIYPCVVNGLQSLQCDPGKNALVADAAKQSYDGLKELMVDWQLPANFVIGETHAPNGYPDGDPGVTNPYLAPGNVSGFNASTLRGTSGVIRPWGEMTNASFPFGLAVNPPYYLVP